MSLTIASSLLGVFSMLVAFLGFLCALFFTKKWEPSEITAFKVLIPLICISVVIMGATCSYIFHTSLLQETGIMLNFSLLPIVIDIVIVCLIVGALFVTAVAVKRKG